MIFPFKTFECTFSTFEQPFNAFEYAFKTFERKINRHSLTFPTAQKPFSLSIHPEIYNDCFVATHRAQTKKPPKNRFLGGLTLFTKITFIRSLLNKLWQRAHGERRVCLSPCTCPVSDRHRTGCNGWSPSSRS